MCLFWLKFVETCQLDSVQLFIALLVKPQNDQKDKKTEIEHRGIYKIYANTYMDRRLWINFGSVLIAFPGSSTYV